MITIKLRPREEVLAAYRKDRPQSVEKPPRPINLGPVLDLGNVVFFHFRGRHFGVPALPAREGEKILDAWLAASSVDVLTRENLPEYFKHIYALRKLVWRNVFPTGRQPWGRILRVFKALGLLRNPFMKASEGEVCEYALFLLQRRTSTPARAQLSRTMRPVPSPGS